MDAEPATPDAFLIFRSGGCPPALQTLCTQQRKPRVVSRAERTPGRYVSIQLHARTCCRCRHHARTPKGARNQSSGIVSATTRSATDIRRSLSRSGIVSSENLAGESLVRNASEVRAITRRSRHSPATHSANDMRHPNDRHHNDGTFHTEPTCPTRSPEGNLVLQDRPGCAGLPKTVSRLRHPNTAADFHRGEWPLKTMSACQPTRTPNPALQPGPHSGFPFQPIHYRPSGPILNRPDPCIAKVPTRRKTCQHADARKLCSNARLRTGNVESPFWCSFLCKTRDTDHNPSTGFPHQAASCRTRQAANPYNSAKSTVLRPTRH